MLLKVAPPSALTCHWMPGVGVPLAAAVNETALPAQTALLAGLAVIAGDELSVTVALPVPCFEQLISLTVVTE